MPIKKYRAFSPVDLPDRQWPGRTITQAPIWCSVDLRDGNQALKIPMNLEEKLIFFQLLTDLGFKEIEVGFPAAAEVEYQFLRKLIEDDLIPDDVTVQVLTQSREELITKTFAGLENAKRAIFHLYNSTSTLQREVVFKMNRREIIDIAVNGTRQIRQQADEINDTDIIFEYSPESFTGTELEFAIDICEAVMDVWQPTPEKKAIINLPATVEMSTPNIFADMIEWFCNHFSWRDSVIISLHTHNDRGTGVAATELGLMAGADRVEGTLFGCGERTGNVDIVNLALNLFSQGVDPCLDFTEINNVADVFMKCTKMPIHPRHPYVGELVYTAFSGSHQDAIKKGMDVYDEKAIRYWAVPYLPIDPGDVGRTYEKIIQINSQSGKGGVAYIIEYDFGYKMPKDMHPEFGQVIQRETDITGKDLPSARIFELFRSEYLTVTEPFLFRNCEIQTKGATTRVKVELEVNGLSQIVEGEGNGPLDALGNGIKQSNLAQFKLISYSEHALEQKTSSSAAAYIRIEKKGIKRYGVGVDPNISIASIKALICALNRAILNEKSEISSAELKN